jgi:NADP-dependent 3-hydroxy acid dehydrogenase YdfG
MRQFRITYSQLAGKVHIVTGGYAGCGYELVKIFYQKNATVYVAGRSKEKAEKAIAVTSTLAFCKTDTNLDSRTSKRNSQSPKERSYSCRLTLPTSQRSNLPWRNSCPKKPD